MNKYVLVSFPEIQDFMEHPRWSECIFCQGIEGHPCEDSTYAVPEDLYEWVSDYNSVPDFIRENLGKTFTDGTVSGVLIGYNSRVGAIVQREKSYPGWYLIDGWDIVLVPQEEPNYGYLDYNEFLEKWKQV